MVPQCSRNARAWTKADCNKAHMFAENFTLLSMLDNQAKLKPNHSTAQGSIHFLQTYLTIGRARSQSWKPANLSKTSKLYNVGKFQQATNLRWKLTVLSCSRINDAPQRHPVPKHRQNNLSTPEFNDVFVVNQSASLPKLMIQERWSIGDVGKVVGMHTPVAVCWFGSIMYVGNKYI